MTLGGQAYIPRLFSSVYVSAPPPPFFFFSRAHSSGVVTLDSTGFPRYIHLRVYRDRNTTTAARTRGKSDGRALLAVTCVGVRLREGAQAQLRSRAPRSTWSPPATTPRYCRLSVIRTGLKQVNNIMVTPSLATFSRDGDMTLISEGYVTSRDEGSTVRENYGYL